MTSKSVEIPDAMYDHIQDLIAESPELGYESVDEYVREAVRKQIEGMF